jgi:hypothetical protein
VCAIHSVVISWLLDPASSPSSSLLFLMIALCVCTNVCVRALILHTQHSSTHTANVSAATALLQSSTFCRLYTSLPACALARSLRSPCCSFLPLFSLHEIRHQERRRATVCSVHDVTPPGSVSLVCDALRFLPRCDLNSTCTRSATLPPPLRALVIKACSPACGKLISEILARNHASDGE